jgi:hypothetical protein
MFAQDPAITPFFALAIAHRKPVMLAEESPRYVGAQNGATSWDGWFEQFFAFMQATPVVKQFDYIDWNWANYPQWSNWGDARLETSAAAYVLNLYVAQLASPAMLNAGSETAFRKLLGYNNSTPPPAVMDLGAAAGENGVVLTWTPVSDPSGIARYYIYRDNAFLSYSLSSGFVDTTVVPGSAYSYTVAAMDRAGNLAAASNPASVIVTSVDMLVNGGFENGLTDWQLTAMSGAVGNVVASAANPIDGSASAELTVSNSTGTNWDLQIYQPFTMTQGVVYTVSFKARASAPLNLPFVLQQPAAPNTVYLYETAALGVTANTFQYSFTAPVSGPVNASFYYGNINPNTVWLDDVSVQELAPGEMLANGGFEMGLTDWQLQALSGAVGNVVASTSNPIDGAVSAELTVSNSTGTNWDLQLYQPFTMTQGLGYTVTFKARASAPLSLPFVLQQYAAPNTVYLWQAAAVGVTANTFQYSLTAPASGLVNASFYYGNVNPNTVWLDDVSVQQSTPVVPGPQIISFPALYNQALGTPPFAVGATASSGLTVAFASTTSTVCTVSGSTVTLVAVGTCTIQASQAGNVNYAAAPSVSRSFPVTQYSMCNLSKSGVTTVTDVQLMINEALGVTPQNNDLNGDGQVTVADVQIVINAALGLGCDAV